MTLKHYLYGAVFFSNTNRRNSARTLVENQAAANGFATEAWMTTDGQNMLEMVYGAPWPGGCTNVTQGSFPGFRFCYTHTDTPTVEAAMAALEDNWQVAQDSDSFWARATANVPD
jgi:hypothetical protein